MLSWIEAEAALTGLKRLLRFDAGFAQWFDRTPLGARRSFGLMLPVIPFFLIQNFSDTSLVPGIDMIRVVAVAATYFVLAWVMFPLILIVIGRAIGREVQAMGAITSYNWYNFCLSIVGCTFNLLDSTGILGGSAAYVLLVLILGSLAYESFLLRVTIGIGYGGAILISIVDYALAQSLYILLMSPIMSTTVG